MHTCPPPKDVLTDWLEDYPDTEGNYGHLLLEHKRPCDDDLRIGLRPYFESAHLDARTCFHRFARISLHPDADAPGAHAKYPDCLPGKTKRGLFGEAMAGLVTESYEFVGAHHWIIPVFLFRNHEDVGRYMYRLARDADHSKEIPGRKGDDFIGLVVDDEGNVTRFIAGEAKWRATWTPYVFNEVMLGEKVKDPAGGPVKVHNGKGIWHQLNTALDVPVGLGELQRILEECAYDEYENVILSLDRILSLDNEDGAARTDMILLIGGPAKTRKPRTTLIGFEEVPSEYTAGRDLQVVEAYVENGDQLIDTLYTSLWEDEADNAAA